MGLGSVQEEATPPSDLPCSLQMKLAISYALSQSVKLSVYENRVVDIVEETKNLPGDHFTQYDPLNSQSSLTLSFFFPCNSC